MRRLCATVLFFGMGACDVGDPSPGTQVGFESALSCIVASTETVVDLDSVPDGFSTSPADALASIVGGFEGYQVDSSEQELSLGAGLTVIGVPGDVVLTRYEIVDNVDDIDVAVVCPPHHSLDLDVALIADGLPTFEGTFTAQYSAEGSAWVRHEGEEGFDGELPPPTSFDPAEVDRSTPRVDLRGHEGSWSATITWRAETDDGGGEDGGPSLESEVVMMAPQMVAI